MDEIWKDIPGYEGYYQVSNKGSVRSIERTILQVFRGKMSSRVMKEKTLNIKVLSNGYLAATLSMNGKRKTYRVNRLVAITFIDNPNGYRVVNHKDENKLNNNVDNLEWCTHKYNNTFGQGCIQRKKTMREHTGRKIGQYSMDGKLIQVFDSIGLAGKYMKCNKTSIFKVCKGVNKSCGGYDWKYV